MAPSNYALKLTVQAARPLLAAPPHISSLCGGQGARHAARRLSRRWPDKTTMRLAQACLLTMMLSVACKSGAAQYPDLSSAVERTLLSGRTVTVIRVWHGTLNNRQSIWFEYLRHRPYSLSSFQAEVDDIWKELRPKAERSGATFIHISAWEEDAGSYRSTLTWFERGMDGRWRQSGYAATTCKPSRRITHCGLPYAGQLLA